MKKSRSSLLASTAVVLLGLSAARAWASPAPTATDLLSRPAVREALDKAWNDSASSNATLRHEEGGWIFVAAQTDEIRLVRAPPGSRSSIDLSNPPDIPGFFLVADFHTHPNPNGEGWENSPSAADINYAWTAGVPDLERSEDGPHACGPSSRVGGLLGPAGYPGTVQGAHSDEPAPKDIPSTNQNGSASGSANGGPSGGKLHASVNLQPGASQSWEVAYNAVSPDKAGSDMVTVTWSGATRDFFVLVKAKDGDVVASAGASGGSLVLAWYGRTNRIYTITVKNLSTEAVAADVDFE